MKIDYCIPLTRLPRSNNSQLHGGLIYVVVICIDEVLARRVLKLLRDHTTNYTHSILKLDNHYRIYIKNIPSVQPKHLGTGYFLHIFSTLCFKGAIHAL
ncbi:hypothetical protein FKM82_026629 [Ascaphus truei]